MSQIPIDAPDWQRATVAPGQLLASVASGTDAVTVKVPPNVISVVVQLASGDTITEAYCKGKTTNIYYPGTPINSYGALSSNTGFVFDVLSSVDTECDVYVYPAPTTEWQVYGFSSSLLSINPDSEAVSQVINSPLGVAGILSLGSDGTNARVVPTDINGHRIPLVPTIGLVVDLVAGDNSVLALPPAEYYYLFGLDVYSTGSADNPMRLYDSNGNTIAYDNPPTGGESHSIDLDGFRTNGSVTMNATAAGTMVLRYTTAPV